MSERSTIALQLWTRMIRVVQRVSRAGGERLRQYGLTPAQFELLLQIIGHGSLTQRELTDVLGVTKGSVSQMVARLEQDGFLSRTAEGAALRLGLTRAGKTLVLAIVPEYEAFVAESFASLEPHEQYQLLALLVKAESDLQ
jgi:DNA-binding MarR family transcriptional regulator